MRRTALVAYDVSSNYRRRRLQKTLLAWSVDYQKSVYELLLSTREAEELFTELSQWIDCDSDSLLLFFPSKSEAVHRYGMALPPNLIKPHRVVLKAGGARQARKSRETRRSA